MADTSQDERARVFAENLKRWRIDRGWNQTDLARLMQARGFRFHQQIVQRIENLNRLVRLDEAYALSEIFGVTVDQMSWDLGALRRQELQDAIVGAAAIGTALARGSHDWLERCGPLASHLAHLAEHEPNSERLRAGLELMARIVGAIGLVNRSAHETLATNFSGLDREELSETLHVSESEQLVRDLVDQRRPDDSFSSLTAEELGRIYLASIE